MNLKDRVNEVIENSPDLTPELLEKSQYTPGEIIDNTVNLVRPIGIGGCGEVWEGRHRFIREKGKQISVAIKLVGEIQPGRYEKYTGMDMLDVDTLFEREASHHFQLQKKPHIADFYFMGFDAKRQSLYTIQELVDGINLQTFIQYYGKLPLDTIFEISTQIAKGLQVAHEIGIIHNDLTPRNILINRKGYLKLVDFGLSIMNDESIMAGSLPYMAGEAIDRKPESASDIHSLGVIMTELYTGALPFQSSELDWNALSLDERREQEEELKGEIKHNKPYFKKRLHPQLAIAEECMDKDPSSRPTIDFLVTYLGAPIKRFQHIHRNFIDKTVLTPRDARRTNEEGRELLNAIFMKKVPNWPGEFQEGEIGFAINSGGNKYSRHSVNNVYLTKPYILINALSGNIDCLDEGIKKGEELYGELDDNVDTHNLAASAAVFARLEEVTRSEKYKTDIQDVLRKHHIKGPEEYRRRVFEILNKFEDHFIICGERGFFQYATSHTYERTIFPTTLYHLGRHFLDFYLRLIPEERRSLDPLVDKLIIHAKVTSELQRIDSSVPEGMDIDLSTGEFLGERTFYGCTKQEISCLTRVQGHFMVGSSMMAVLTKILYDTRRKRSLLELSKMFLKQTLDTSYFIHVKSAGKELSPDQRLLCYDLGAPNPTEERETIGTVAVTFALKELSELMKHPYNLNKVMCLLSSQKNSAGVTYEKVVRLNEADYALFKHCLLGYTATDEESDKDNEKVVYEGILEGGILNINSFTAHRDETERLKGGSGMGTDCDYVYILCEQKK